MGAPMSDFARRVEPAARILGMDGWHVWGSSAIDGPDGKVHLLTSRWPEESGFRGWSTHSEIMHSVSDSAEGPFEVVDVALRGRGGETAVSHWSRVDSSRTAAHYPPDTTHGSLPGRFPDRSGFGRAMSATTGR